MKAESNIKPESIQNLGNGTYYINTNIELIESQYQYDSTLIKGNPGYEKVVSILIREKYSLDDEFALNSKSMQMFLNNCTEEQRAKWMIEIEEFTDYRQQCIAKAKDICNLQ